MRDHLEFLTFVINRFSCVNIFTIDLEDYERTYGENGAHLLTWKIPKKIQIPLSDFTHKPIYFKQLIFSPEAQE